MIEIPRSTPQARNGTWSYEVDALAEARQADPWMTFQEARAQWPGIPIGVMKQIFSTRGKGNE